MDREDSISDLLDDADFQLLEQTIASFNLFEAIGAVRGELRHSDFLAFLFSPSRRHGLGAKLLLTVTRELLAKMPKETRPMSVLELMLSDLDDAVVYREWNNVDILIEIGRIKFVILFENKIGAKAGDGQLARYKKLIEGRYANWKRLFVFLTPDGDLPDDPAYQSLSYATLAKILEGMRPDGNDGSSDVAVVLRHYVQMLRRQIVEDEKLSELALQIYERHKEALEFIFASRPQPQSLLDTARLLVESTPGLLQDRPGANIIRFVPDAWINVIALNSCGQQDWTRTGRNLLFQMRTWTSSPYVGRLNLSLVSGPAPTEIRTVIYNNASARADVFKGLVKPMGEQYATIYSKDLLTSVEAQTMTSEEKGREIELRWNAFANDDLPNLRNAVLEIVAKLPAKPPSAD